MRLTADGMDNGAPFVGPEFTIVTPSLNQSAFIEQTILSVRAQNYPHKQHIVVDGGSVDGTIEILKRYEDGLAWWVSEKDCGQSEAIHKGFLRSTGNILCWLNADDVLLPGALTDVAQYFRQHPEKEVVNGGCYFIDAGGRPVDVGRVGFTLGVRASFDRLRLYGNEGLHQPATFWRRDAYFEVGGLDQRLHYSMDLDLFTRLARRGRFGVLPHMLACARRHPGCKTVRNREAARVENDRVTSRYRGRAFRAFDAASALAFATADRARKLRLWALRGARILKLELVRYSPPATPSLTSSVGDPIDFCAYFDERYLGRALALYTSLRTYCRGFRLWCLCLDDATFQTLSSLALEGVHPIRLAALEAHDPELARTREGRSPVEYYFTCTPAWCLYVLATRPEVGCLTYVDSDLFFFSDPSILFQEIAGRSIAIVPHRFPEARRHLEKRFGTYNVGWVSFRRSEAAFACLRRWREQCLDWCFDRVEDDRYADQRYLDDWPAWYGEEVAIVMHPGANLAPWNLARHRVERDGAHGEVRVDGRALVFFHFHGLRQVAGRLFDVGLSPHGVRAAGAVRSGIYEPYLGAFTRAESQRGSLASTRLPHARRPMPWPRIRKVLAGDYVLVPVSAVSGLGPTGPWTQQRSLVAGGQSSVEGRT